MEAPPVIVQRRSTWWVVAVLPLAAVVLILFLFDPSRYGFYPRCVLYTTTGLYCPGCGCLRACHQLAHGHFWTALHYNAPFVLSFPALAIFFVRREFKRLAGKPVPPIMIRTSWIIAAGVALTLFTILRNIPSAPFNWLAPP